LIDITKLTGIFLQPIYNPTSPDNAGVLAV